MIRPSPPSSAIDCTSFGEFEVSTDIERHTGHACLRRSGTIEKIINEDERKPILEYPCRWAYKVIGPDRGAMERAIGEVVGGCACTVTPSRTSKTGKYHCLNVEMVVDDEGHRTGVYDRLRDHPAITMVL